MGLDPVEEEVAGLAAGLAEEDGAGGLEVAAPEGFEERPLDALVEDVGADDDVELLGEAGLLPVEATGADAVGEGEGVELREEQGVGLEVAEEDVRAQSGEPIPLAGTRSALASSCRGSITSVTTGIPVLRLTSASILSAAAPSP